MVASSTARLHNKATYSTVLILYILLLSSDVLNLSWSLKVTEHVFRILDADDDAQELVTVSIGRLYSTYPETLFSGDDSSAESPTVDLK